MAASKGNFLRSLQQAIPKDRIFQEWGEAQPGDAQPQPGERALQGREAPAPAAVSMCGLGVFPQAAAPGDGDEDEDDEDFVEVPEKEGYEASVPDHLQPEYGEWCWGGDSPLRMLTSDGV